MEDGFAIDGGTADAALLSQIAAGASAALEELSRRYSQKIKAEAFRILFDTGEAEEVLQEVLCKVWQRAASYDSRRGSVSSWIFIMTRRRAIDWLRHRRVRLRAEVQQPWQEPCVPLEVHDRELFPGWRLRVRRAFRELPPEQRQVLALALFREMSQSQIADITGIPLGTVKTRTSSAKTRLRQSLEPHLLM
jgi:RNA polymerase sigma factor (sigma-70 family)